MSEAWLALEDARIAAIPPPSVLWSARKPGARLDRRPPLGADLPADEIRQTIPAAGEPTAGWLRAGFPTGRHDRPCPSPCARVRRHAPRRPMRRRWIGKARTVFQLRRHTNMPANSTRNCRSIILFGRQHHEIQNISSVRFRNPINTGDFRGWEIRKWVGFEKEPVKWVFSPKV